MIWRHAVNALMAQRLVRKLCDCKTKRQLTEEEKIMIKEKLKNISEKSGIVILPIEFVYEPKGCEKCNKIGYKGRTTISEVFVVDRDIEEMIMQNASSTQLQDKAIENGMVSMEQDGMLKVLEGETTLSEVERVI
jgi:type IV pilus assembly protein PilB